ncbi:MAG: hypothetical protein LQ347_003716 [Umbilicaria vellea]|nr:MAG: hypothetical protein LQ347_003716 [Umbilicaria vellea]
MEKIRNILNPSAKYDEEVLYGSGRSSDPVHSGTSGTTSSGPGSHLGGSSTTPSSATGYDNTGTGTGSNTYDSGNTLSSSRAHGGLADDGASTTAIRHGVPGNTQSGSTMTGSSGANDLLDTNKPLPQAPGSTGTGLGGASSTLGSGRDLPDRTVGQSGYGSTGSDSSTGRSFPLGGGSNTTGYGSGTGPATGSAHQGSLGRDATVGTGAVGAAGLADRELGGQRNTAGANPSGVPLDGVQDPYGPESWQHRHVGHGHAFEGDPCETGAPPALPHFTAGPHITDTANRLDPHVAGGSIGGSTDSGTGHHGHHGHRHGQHEASTGAGIGSTGAGIGSTGSGLDSSNRGYDDSRSSHTSGTGAGIGSTGTGLGSSSRGYDDSRTSGTSGGIGSSGTGLGMGRADDSGLGTGVSQRAYESTTGPASHERDNTGKYDTLASGTPSGVNLGSTGSSSGHGSGSGMGTRGTDYDSQREDRHLGRDAALAGGVGAAGAGMYEVGRDHPISTSGPASSTAGPHKYDIMNKMDPRVKETTMSSTTGTIPRDEVPSSGTIGRDHHYGRDAGLAGAGGVAAYEAEKHHNKHEVPQQVTGRDSTVAGTQPAGYHQPPPVGGTGHHYGRDAGLVGAGGVAAYEGEKYLGHDRTGASSYPEDRHTGRDTALAGGAGAVGGAEFSKKEAEKQAEKHQKALAKEEKREEKAEHKHGGLLHKDHSKEDKAIQKEHIKEEKHHDGKKHGLFGFLHRDKPDPELKEEEAARQAQLHGHAGNVSTVAGVAVAEDEHGHHKLHKDPPPGYAPAPESGYASQVTGGTGTTALAQGDSVQRGSHISGAGNKLDPSVGERADTVDDSVLGYRGQGSTGSGLGGYSETAGTGHGGHGVHGDHPYNAAGEAAHRLHHNPQGDIGLGPERLEADRSHIGSSELRRDAAHGGTSGFDSTTTNPSSGLGGGTMGSQSGRY